MSGNCFLVGKIQMICISAFIISSFLIKNPAKIKTGIAQIGPMKVEASREGDAAPIRSPIDCTTRFVKTRIVLNKKNRSLAIG